MARIRLAFLVCIAVALVGSGLSHAQSKSKSRSSTPQTAVASIEVIDKSTSTAVKRARFDSRVALDGPGSHFASSIGDARYEIDFDWRTVDGGPAQSVSLEVEHHGPKAAPTRVRMSTVDLKRGVRTVLANMARPDGSQFEIAITMR